MAAEVSGSVQYENSLLKNSLWTAGVRGFQWQCRKAVSTSVSERVFGREACLTWYGFPYMKTTLNIDDSVIQRLREEAARRGTTMSALVEAVLRRVLAAPEADEPPPALPTLPSWNGGQELVDISDRDALYRAMEEE